MTGLSLASCSNDYSYYAKGKMWAYVKGFRTGIGDFIHLEGSDSYDSISRNTIYRLGKPVAIITGTNSGLNEMYVRSPYTDSTAVFVDAVVFSR